VGVAVADGGRFWKVAADQASGPEAGMVSVAINPTERFRSVSGDDSVVLLANSSSVGVTGDIRMKQLSQLLAAWAVLLAAMAVAGRVRR
jgi:hypothetical protein